MGRLNFITPLALSFGTGTITISFPKSSISTSLPASIPYFLRIAAGNSISPFIETFVVVILSH